MFDNFIEHSWDKKLSIVIFVGGAYLEFITVKQE